MRRSGIELSNLSNLKKIQHRRDDLSFLSAISQKKSVIENDENEKLDVKNEKTKRRIDRQRLFLDVELNLQNEDNSHDEAHFRLEENTQIFIQNAFQPEEHKINFWKEKYISLLTEHFSKTNINFNFSKFISEKNISKIIEEKSSYENICSFNLSKADEENPRIKISYFPKFLIAINLLFRVSYLYKYTYDLGYKKTIDTILRILTLSFFDFDNQSTLFSIDNLVNQYCFFGLVFFWLVSFITLRCLIAKENFKRKVSCQQCKIIYSNSSNNNIINSLSTSNYLIFNIALMLSLYLYAPIVRDAIMTIFFVNENITLSLSFQIFFQIKNSLSVLLWIKFFICIIIVISFFYVPFYFYKLIGQFHPLINIFDEYNDSLFHATDCPPICDGALLDINKRMCWDNLKNKELYFADLSRPISKLEIKNKLDTALKKYSIDCFTIKSPLMIIFKGFSFYDKYHLFWFLIAHYLFLFIFKMPFSTVFPDFVIDNMIKRTLISYSFSVVMCGYFIFDNFKSWERRSKFYLKHDMVLTLFVDIFICGLSILSLVKVAVAGNYIFSDNLTTNTTDNTNSTNIFNNNTNTTIDNLNNISSLNTTSLTTFTSNYTIILLYFEAFSFALLLSGFVILIIFIIYSIPNIREKMKTLKFEIPYDMLNEKIENTIPKLNNNVKEFLWKTFWDNFFKYDENLSKEFKFISEFPSMLDNVNQIYQDEGSNNHLSKSALNALHLLKRKNVNSSISKNKNKNKKKIKKLNSKISEEGGQNLNLINSVLKTNLDPLLDNKNLHRNYLKKSDLLLRKLIQFKLEGIDVFWDGDIIGRRSTLNYFGRLIVVVYPFKLYMIYDETSEKVEIPESQWIELLKLNLHNPEVKRQVNTRDKIRTLHLKNVIYDEFYLERENEYYSDYYSTTLKKGVLHVETKSPENPFMHGFKIYLTISPKEQINFDTNEICLNKRNFKFSKLNILLEMNKSLIKEEDCSNMQMKKDRHRELTCLKRYINEVTLSSDFAELIYNNEETSLLDVFTYFIKFEKRNEIKILPYIYIDVLLRVMNLWSLLLTNKMQAFWYTFFHRFWTLNKNALIDLKIAKYFNPDTSLSICYYVFDRNKLESFISKLDLHSLIKKDVVDKLLFKIEELKKWEKFVMEAKIKRGIDMNVPQNKYSINDNLEQFYNNDYDKKNVSSINFSNHSSKKNRKFTRKKSEMGNKLTEIPLNQTSLSKSNINISQLTYSNLQPANDLTARQPLMNTDKLNPVDEDQLEKIMSDYQPFRNKFLDCVLEYSPVMLATPTWEYCTYNDDFLYNRIPSTTVEDLKKIIKNYFSKNLKNPNLLFHELNEYGLFLKLYDDNEIFQLYLTKELNCNDPEIAKFTLDKDGKQEDLILKTRDKPAWLTSLDWGSKEIEIVLPPIYKFSDVKFTKPLNPYYAMKVDDMGRVFYVDNRDNKTTFLHPELKRREKTRLESDMDMLHGKLPDHWEIINYKTKKDEIRLLYVDHKNKETTWIDPRTKYI